jgi:hypothetical protein
MRMIVIALAMIVPLGSADAYTVKKSAKSLSHENVCLTPAGWCYPAVTTGQCSCIATSGWASGTIVNAATMRAGIPHIGEATGLPDIGGTEIESNKTARHKLNRH